ncbi:hypothetical protein [Chryseobacterium sp. ERMR1:04]|uniref:hypothetical protein n=1 Tax=Chryseobacterium sp. ERMR1:04 TaxID=1705393 RepID=UPI000F50E95B|nr:hypothetical protein [Chryseobacterium sp. ERMR1:04]
MLGKNVAVFDEKQNTIGKITIVEHLIPINKEMKEAVKNKGFMYVLAFDFFNNSSNTENIRIINYFDFIEQKNNYSEILLQNFTSILTQIEKDLEDYILDNYKTDPEGIKLFINSELLQQFHNCKEKIEKNLTYYKFAPLVFSNLVTFYIDNENIKKISGLFNRSMIRIIENHKKYIDITSPLYKTYKEENKFILKKDKNQKKDNKHENNIDWKDIFKEKSTYKQFVKYSKNHIVNGFVDYSYLFQKMKQLEFVFNHKHFKYIDWLNENNFITERDYEEFLKNAGFRSLSKSYSEQRENNFSNIFNL